MTCKDDGNKFGRTLLLPMQCGAAVLLAIAAFVMLASILFRSHYGFDFTDEGYCMLWMTNPSSYATSVTLFGFFYHPLYSLVHGDVASIRTINDLITFGLAWILCAALFYSAFGKVNFTFGKISFLLALSAVVGSASLLVTAFELPQSPSYNTLAYQAILVCLIGLVIADASNPRLNFFGCVLIGVSWWVAFMAKPTTALALGLLTIVYVLILGKFRLRLIAVAAATAVLLLFISAWAIDGSARLFIERFVKSIELMNLLEGENVLSSIWRWDIFPLGRGKLWFLLLISMGMSAVIFASTSESRVFRNCVIVVCVAFAVAVIGIFAGGYTPESHFERYDGLLMLALPIGCLICAMAMNGFRSVTRWHFALVIFLLLVPFAYAFGTGRPYWLNAEGTALFWILSGIVLISAAKPASLRAVLPVGGGALIMTALFVSASMEHPMRQTESFRMDTEIVDINPHGGPLVISTDFAAYINGLRQLARTGEFKAGTPIIDMTGHSPGAVYVLGGTAPGTVWLLGGYKGSGTFAAAVLNSVSCDALAQAWVITEPSGPGALPKNILKRYGIDPQQDYRDLGTVQTPAAPYPISYAQHLLKPRRSYVEARSECELKRRAS